MNKLILLLFFIAFTNCNNKPKDTKNVSSPIENTESGDSEALLEVGCYTYKGNNSSIIFEITQLNKFVTGNLQYHLAEKDKNIGTFEGVLIDDILLGDYIFESEGSTSKREVIFKIINHQLIEGYGAMDEDGICFVNTDHVTFSSTMPLAKTNCKK